MQVAQVMAEWQKLNFAETFELIRSVINKLNEISRQVEAQGKFGQNNADRDYELLHRDYNDLDVAFFSSGASLTFPGTNNALIHKPDIVAPGAQIYSCIPPAQRTNGIVQYTYMDGTSMATPHVAGVAALLMAAQPTAQVEDIIKVLKETAQHPQGNQLRPDNRWGYGLIQPIAALQALTS